MIAAASRDDILELVSTTVQGAEYQELSGTPNPWCFLKSIAGTNGRRTAVQMGGVLQYKLEVHCGVSLSPKL